MKYSDSTRRQLMVEASQPTPRSPGRKLQLTLTLYEAGHSALNTQPSALSVMSNNDAELIKQFTLLVRGVREQLAP